MRPFRKYKYERRASERAYKRYTRNPRGRTNSPEWLAIRALLSAGVWNNAACCLAGLAWLGWIFAESPYVVPTEVPPWPEDISGTFLHIMFIKRFRFFVDSVCLRWTFKFANRKYTATTDLTYEREILKREPIFRLNIKIKCKFIKIELLSNLNITLNISHNFGFQFLIFSAWFWWLI